MFFTHIKNITLLKKKLLNILQFAINKTTIMGGEQVNEKILFLGNLQKMSDLFHDLWL